MTEKYQKIVGNIFCYGTVSFAVLLAKEKGIFNTLLEADSPLTSQEIADKSKIRERYTRELLGCLTAVELVTVASEPSRGVPVYHLEPEAKEVLGNGLSLPYMNFTAMISARYGDVKDSLDLQKPAAVRYNQQFFDLLEELRVNTSPTVREAMLGNVPGLRQRLEQGIHVIELGCGMAYTLSQMAAMFPASTFTASDVTPEIMDKLKEKFLDRPNMRFEMVDLNAVPENCSTKYDWLITNDVIHDLPFPLEALKGIRRMTRDEGGVYTCLDLAGSGSHQEDSGDLISAALYACSSFMCIPESFQCPGSEAHGARWGMETVKDYLAKARFQTSVHPIGGFDTLFVCTPI